MKYDHVNVPPCIFISNTISSADGALERKTNSVSFSMGARHGILEVWPVASSTRARGSMARTHTHSIRSAAAKFRINIHNESLACARRSASPCILIRIAKCTYVMLARAPTRIACEERGDIAQSSRSTTNYP